MKAIANFLIVALVLVERSLAQSCPEGSTAQGDYCFIASKEPDKYQYAEMFCLNYGCHVAVPFASMKSDLQTFGITNGLTQVSFAVVDALSERVWIEAKYGQVFTDTDWANNKPSTSRNNNCIRIDDLAQWKMTDTSCNGRNSYICACDKV